MYYSFSLVSHICTCRIVWRKKSRRLILHVLNIIKWVNIWIKLSVARGFVYILAFLYWSTVLDSWKKKCSCGGECFQVKWTLITQDEAKVEMVVMWNTECVCITKAFPVWKYQMFSRYRPHIGRMNWSRSVPYWRENFSLPVFTIVKDSFAIGSHYSVCGRQWLTDVDRPDHSCVYYQLRAKTKRLAPRNLRQCLSLRFLKLKVLFTPCD